MKLSVYNLSGSVVDEVELDEAIFGVAPNVALMHQIVVGQEANRRVGTAATKTRAVIRGTTKKMYKQKGTGRARHGSRKVPSWTGGGVAHGPHPRSYDQHLPKKMRRAAIRSALSVKARDGQIVLLDALELAAPRTKDMVSLLGRLPVSGKVLLTLDQANQNVQLSARNLQRVSTLPANALSTREVLRHDYLLATVPAIRVLERWLSPTDAGAEATEAEAAEEVAAAVSSAAAVEAETPTPRRARARAAAAAEVAEVAEPSDAAPEASPAAESSDAAPEAATGLEPTGAVDEAAADEEPTESSDQAAPKRRGARKSESDE